VYNPYTGAYGVGRAVYGPYGSAGTAAWYNPATGNYGWAVTAQNAYGGRTYAQTYNPWTGTYAATSQGHNQYSQWGSSVVTNGDNWAQAQHVTNSQGTTGSFQTSNGSGGAGFSGANGNTGFVVKDANNNNVYAGADGNVYKKDSSGNWSKYNDGSWTPVDPSTGANQTRQKTQDQSGSSKLSQTQSSGNGPGAAQSGTATAASVRNSGQNYSGTLRQGGARPLRPSLRVSQVLAVQFRPIPWGSYRAIRRLARVESNLNKRKVVEEAQQQVRADHVNLGRHAATSRESGPPEKILRELFLSQVAKQLYRVSFRRHL
jgi:hypothetical protein